MNAIMLSQYAVLLFCLVVFSVPYATAGTDELEALIKKSLDQAKAAGVKYDNQACGHYFIADGEFIKTTPDGKSVNYPINRTGIEPWGCNEKPNDVQVTNKFESKESQTEGGTAVQYVANAYGVYSFDRNPSTEIAGTVVDKNNKPVKNADVKAEDINLNKPAFTTRTDEQGKYTLKVSSGQYRVSAQAKDCKAEQNLWACSWGKILEPSKHTSRFPLDIVANCTSDKVLNVSGTVDTNVHVNYEGVVMNASLGMRPVDGKIPLSLDAKTGQISGEGTLHFKPAKMRINGTAPEGVTTHSSGTNSAENWQIKITGQLDHSTNTASMTAECVQIEAFKIAANVVVRKGKDGVSQSTSHVNPAESCEWKVPIKMTWDEGASDHVDRHDVLSQDGSRYDRHELLDFILGEGKEKEKRDDKSDDRAPPPAKPEIKNTPPSIQGGTQKDTGAHPSPALNDTPPPKKKPRNATPAKRNNVPIVDEEISNDDLGTTDDEIPTEAVRNKIKHLNLPPEVQDKIPEQIQEMMQQFGTE